MNAARLLCLPLLAAVGACGDKDGADAERRTAAGEVLGGSISDDMLPLDTVTSQSPPLKDEAEDGSTRGQADAGRRRSDPTPAAQAEAEAEPEPVAPPAPEQEEQE